MYYLPYLGKTFHSVAFSGKFWNPLSFRSKYFNLNKSPEKIMLCAHYAIEKEFVKKGIRPFGRVLSWIAAPWFYGPLTVADPWKTLLGQMDTLEKAVANTNRWVLGDGNKKLKLITRYSEIADLADNEIAVIHAIEGGHAFGYGPEKGQSIEQFWEIASKRISLVKKRGVALITLAHFWDNCFAPQTDGTEYVPKKVNGKIVGKRDDAVFQMKRAKWKWGDRDYLADNFARKLLESGILIDVSHVQEHARWKIYDLCEQHNRPVVASHVGLQHFFNHEYNMSDAEIKRIHDLGGVVGLILSRRWLVDPVTRYGTDGKGAADLVQNMVHIKNLTGDVCAIGIGTDFDGLTDPFKDCYRPDQFDNIIKEMEKHFSDGEIDQILFGNGIRVLEKGWD